MNDISPQLQRQIRHALCCGAALVALLAPAAWGQSCSVSATAPNFGVYNPAAADAITTGLISVTCNVSGPLALNVLYTIELGMGANASGTQRNLAGGTGGTGQLAYNLFCDITYSQVWGDGSNGSCVRTGGRLLLLGPLLSTFAVYARAPRGQFVSAGSYTDLITIRVLY